jgi:cyclase
MRKRIIPVLLLDGARRLVKTVGFDGRTYIGDPFNVVRLFNEREVDELFLLAIDAGPQKKGPDFEFLAKFAGECFMPVAYGGGIATVEQCYSLNRLGFEKLVVTSRADDSILVSSIARDMGSQALVTSIDYFGSGADAKTKLGVHPLVIARQRAESGFGEIILQSIDRDGARSGYDLATIEQVAAGVDVPVIALGGAGSCDHFRPALEVGASAAASGSAFTFIGRRRAVLVTYPGQSQLDEIAGTPS